MEESERPEQISVKYFIPLIIIIAVIPLVTFGKIVELPLSEANFWKGGTTHVDFFSYYKSTLLIILSCTALLSFAILILRHKITIRNLKSCYVLLGIYSVFVILSSVFSDNINVAFQGFIEMNQGMSVLLCYILLVFVTANIISGEREIKIIVKSFIVLTVTIGLLGLGQYFGYDLFQTDTGRQLITPKSLADADLNFTFGKYTIYATMYNTNFVGSFGALVLPLATMLYLHAESRKKEVLMLLSALLAYTTWLGCNSRAGYLGIGASAIVFLIFFRKTIRQKYKKLVFLSIIFIFIAAAFNSASGGRVQGQLSRLNPVKEADRLNRLKEERVIFKDVSIKGSILTIETETEKLTMELAGDELIFVDGNGNALSTVRDAEDYITIRDERYKEYIFRKTDGFTFIDVYAYKRPLNLYAAEDGMLKVISMNYKLTEPVAAPRVKIFDGRETFASNRGYIWSRSIPMLKDTLLLGYGPDNFCMMFPQEDYVGRFNTGAAMINIVVDKPHNMFLQHAINTGMLSLLALILLWSLYLYDCMRLYGGKKISSFTQCIGASVFLSITAYLTAGMFNDNIVSVTPLFWIMLGMGIAVNNMIKIDNCPIQC